MITIKKDQIQVTCRHEKPYAGDCSGCLGYGWDSSAPLRPGYFRKGEAYCKVKRGEMTEEELCCLEDERNMTGANEQINKNTRYKWGILETYHAHQKQWFMATDKEAAVLGLPKRKKVKMSEEIELGVQEPPDDFRIFNRKQKNGTYKPISEFFEHDIQP